jgi:hypothetical protein
MWYYGHYILQVGKVRCGNKANLLQARNIRCGNNDNNIEGEHS